MIIQALEWRNRLVEQWSSQGAMLGTALLALDYLSDCLALYPFQP